MNAAARSGIHALQGVEDAHPPWPSVGVVIPTRGRPELLRRAVHAALEQDYPGEVRVLVVFDQSEPDGELPAADARITALANTRTPGLAGARNAGIEAADTDLVAFCDDDDTWLRGKLRAQVEALRRRPAAEFASCSVVIDFDDRSNERLAGLSEVTYEHLVRSRMTMLHSSTFLAWREALCHGVGLLDETIPGSQNEDWDILLRAARRHPIVHVDQPLVRILWTRRSSYFARQWETKIASLRWMLEAHPDIGRSPVGAGRVYGQLAFAYASTGQRGQAVRWSLRALRAHRLERRAFVALGVTSGLVSGERVLDLAHRYGHGI